MENIKFIKTITNYVDKTRVIIGNCVYFNLANGNKVKLWCYEMGVGAEVINKLEGRVDRTEFPFANYFEPTQCSPGAPKWTQHIDRGTWYFEDSYKHVLPKVSDYMNIARAIEMYIEMYE
jgi:hypothetical protein